MDVGIHPSVNFTKQKRAVKPGISVCSRTMRLMSNQTKSQRKAANSHRRESDDKNAVAIVKIVPQFGWSRKTWMRWLLKEAHSSGETRCKKSWDQFEKYGSLSLRYVKQVPGKERIIAWKNTSQTSTSAKSLRYEI